MKSFTWGVLRWYWDGSVQLGLAGEAAVCSVWGERKLTVRQQCALVAMKAHSTQIRASGDSFPTLAVPCPFIRVLGGQYKKESKKRGRVLTIKGK